MVTQMTCTRFCCQPDQTAPVPTLEALRFNPIKHRIDEEQRAIAPIKGVIREIHERWKCLEGFQQDFHNSPTALEHLLKLL